MIHKIVAENITECVSESVTGNVIVIDGWMDVFFDFALL